MTELVWATASHKRSSGTSVYHTDKECPNFPDHPVQRNRQSIESDPGWRVCQVCAGTGNEGIQTGTQLASELEKMDPEMVQADD